MYFRKAAIANQEIQYFKADGPSLNMLTTTVSVPECFRVPNEIECRNESGVTNIGWLTIYSGPNNNVRAVIFILLNMCFKNENIEEAEDVLLRLKEAVYNSEIPVQYLAEVLHYSHLTVLSRANLIKKVLFEFLQSFTYSKAESIWTHMQNYPIANLTFIILFRSALFNHHQDISLLDFTKYIHTARLLDIIVIMIGLKYKALYENQFYVEGRWVVREQQDILTVRLRKDIQNVSSEETYLAESAEIQFEWSNIKNVKNEQSSPEKRRKIVIEDARNAISEETHPTESDAQSEVVYKHEFFRYDNGCQDSLANDSDIFEFPIKTLYKKLEPDQSQLRFEQQADSRLQINLQVNLYEPVSPVPLNYLMKKQLYLQASRNNNLFDLKGKLVRTKNRSNDSKGRRVSLSKQRLSAKKKPKIRTMRELGHCEAIFIHEGPNKKSNEFNNNSSSYNPTNMGAHQPDRPTLQFTYSNAIHGLLPKSHSQQKKPAKMDSPGTVQEEEKIIRRVDRRQQSPYDRSRIIAEARRRNNY